MCKGRTDHSNVCSSLQRDNKISQSVTHLIAYTLTRGKNQIIIRMRVSHLLSLRKWETSNGEGERVNFFSNLRLSGTTSKAAFFIKSVCFTRLVSRKQRNKKKKAWRNCSSMYFKWCVCFLLNTEVVTLFRCWLYLLYNTIIYWFFHFYGAGRTYWTQVNWG